MINEVHTVDIPKATTITIFLIKQFFVLFNFHELTFSFVIWSVISLVTFKKKKN